MRPRKTLPTLDRIKKIITEGKTEKAIQELLDLFQGQEYLSNYNSEWSELHDLVIMQSSAYNLIKNKILGFTIEDERAGVKINRINSALLMTLKEVKKVLQENNLIEEENEIVRIKDLSLDTEIIKLNLDKNRGPFSRNDENRLAVFISNILNVNINETKINRLKENDLELIISLPKNKLQLFLNFFNAGAFEKFNLIKPEVLNNNHDEVEELEDASSNIQARSVKDVARGMALNLVNVSLGNLVTKEVIEEINTYDNALNNGPIVNQRFIVVVGAGASYNASKSLPLGRSAGEVLKNKFPGLSELIEDELVRLENVYKLNRDEFETVLLAISKFKSKELVDEIHKLYNHKHNPSISYELLAHLLKHRFIDGIINFNFDELLDQSIDDELVNGEFIKIITDGDVQDNITEIMDDDGLKLPIYIKPHGTASHKSSMRFTDEDYYGMPVDIKNLIKALVSGSTSLDEKDFLEDEQRTPVNILIIGYRMKGFEFNSIIEKYLPENSQIYFINPSLPPISDTIKKFYSNGNFFQITKNKTLNDWLLQIWDFISSNFSDTYKPRSINRHLLITKLFADDNKLKSGKKLINYLKDRTYIELVLSIAKYKGFVTIKQLSDDRFGKYYRLYRRKLEETGINEIPSIIEFCETLGMKDYSYSRETLILKDITNDSNSNLTFKSNIFEKEYLDFVMKVFVDKKKLSYSLQRKFKDPEIFELFKNTLIKFSESGDTEINPKYERVFDNVFSKPQVIKTNLAFDFYTRYFINNSEWDTLFIVAETGEWVINKIDDDMLIDKTVIIIIADEVVKEELEEKLSVCRYYEIQCLHWWLHNQHMTIFLNHDQDDNLQIINSLYLIRRLRTSQITPVILDKKDSNILIETFIAYYLKAKRSFKLIDKPEVIREFKRLKNNIKSRQ